MNSQERGGEKEGRRKQNREGGGGVLKLAVLKKSNLVRAGDENERTRVEGGMCVRNRMHM